MVDTLAKEVRRMAKEARIICWVLQSTRREVPAKQSTSLQLTLRGIVWSAERVFITLKALTEEEWRMRCLVLSRYTPALALREMLQSTCREESPQLKHPPQQRLFQTWQRVAEGISNTSRARAKEAG